MQNGFMTLREVYEMLGLPFVESSTLLNMPLKDIPKMTKEQAALIRSEMGCGWRVNSELTPNDGYLQLDFTSIKKED